MIKWESDFTPCETYCVAEIEQRAIMIVLTDTHRWRWRVEVGIKRRWPTGECATLDEAKKNAVATYRYVIEAPAREALIQERAAVVAYLRRISPAWPAGTGGYADVIERGEHRREDGT